MTTKLSRAEARQYLQQKVTVTRAEAADHLDVACVYYNQFPDLVKSWKAAVLRCYDGEPLDRDIENIEKAKTHYSLEKFHDEWHEVFHGTIREFLCSCLENILLRDVKFGICPICGKAFIPKRTSRRFCTDTCRVVSHQRKKTKKRKLKIIKNQ